MKRFYNAGPISLLRILALSATVSNMDDIAKWLDSKCFEFGDSYRPVPLQLYVFGYQKTQSDFLFDNSLSYKICDLIISYSSGKPSMIFCSSRKGCISAAKQFIEDCRAKSYHLVQSQTHRNQLVRESLVIEGIII
jgi:ATP-dependent DNA helicase HFM1/MER3